MLVGNAFRFLGVVNGFSGAIPALMLADINVEQLHVDMKGENLVDVDLLGPEGVGDLSNIPGILNVDGQKCEGGDTCYLDNRHLSSHLKGRLCNTAPLQHDGKSKEMGLESTVGGYSRHYLDTLLSMAWPDNAQLWLCCEDPAGNDDSAAACEEPTYTFPQEPGTLGIAPHFLTGLFERGQQEALTAAFVASINTSDNRLPIDVAGRFDLGAAGTKLITRDNTEEYSYKIGRSWGNMFLHCSDEEADDPLCQASLELDRPIGRDELYHPYAMFSCSDEGPSPSEIAEKSCYCEDMATNAANGCGMVAAVGDCDSVCVGNFCGVNDPPIEGRGGTNVLYVYTNERPREDDEGFSLSSEYGGGQPQSRNDTGGVVALSVVLAVVVLIAALSIFLGNHKRSGRVENSDNKPTTKTTLASIDEEQQPVEESEEN